MGSPWRHGSRTTAVLAVAAALPVLLAGCGGGGGDATTQAGTTQAETTTAAVSPELAAKVKHLIDVASQSQVSKTQQEAMRVADAEAELLSIAKSNPVAIAPLTAAIQRPDYQVVADLYNFYIQLGRPGSEKVLIGALDKQEFSETSSPMALAFISSGNKQLIRAAREWAANNGLTISGQPSGIGPKWGQAGLPTPSIPTAPAPSP